LFTQLPFDLGQLHSVVNINLSNVMLDDFENAVASLATIPELKSLYINLHEEAQVDYIIRELPYLEFLNGLPVDREILDVD